jgi:hypothetical protein
VLNREEDELYPRLAVLGERMRKVDPDQLKNRLVKVRQWLAAASKRR